MIQSQFTGPRPTDFTQMVMIPTIITLSQILLHSFTLLLSDFRCK
jgi:hypothetical protein